MTDARDMTYGQYLTLDKLLHAQDPVSDHHDELLFIIIHQTKELWLKQVIHELRLALDLVRADKLIEVHKNLSRVSRIQAVMTLSWDVLATLTPTDYMTFRHVLGTSSGFQSAQFREMEFLLGLKDGAHLKFQEEELGAARGPGGGAGGAEPLGRGQCRARPGRLRPAGRGARAGLVEKYEPSDAVEAAWAEVYRNTEKYWEFYQFAEKLMDIDDSMAVWRHKHVVTVERVIGFKTGTGGTAGVPYLQKTITKRAFPELWGLRTRL